MVTGLKYFLINKNFYYLFLIIKMIIITIILVILFLILYNRKKIPYIPTSKINNKPLKCCILLTMYIGNDESRRKIYENNVKRWLEETNLEIFTVDSSGKYINQTNPRLHQFSFNQNTDFVASNPSIYEKNSILYALDYFCNDILKFDMIFKVTGKYFIPGIEKKFKYIPSNAEIVLQNRTDTAWPYGQNTEIIGIRSDIIKKIISKINTFHKKFQDFKGDISTIATNKYNETSLFEKTIYNIVNSGKYKCYRFHPLKLDTFSARGDGSVLKYL